MDSIVGMLRLWGMEFKLSGQVVGFVSESLNFPSPIKASNVLWTYFAVLSCAISNSVL